MIMVFQSLGYVLVDYGISKLPICPHEFSTTLTVTWKCFENEIIGVKWDEKPQKKIVEVYKETSLQVFLNTSSLNCPNL